MITTITEHDFINAFKSWETYKNNFSYEGLKVLFEYLDEYEDSTGEPIELDVVALCCEWTEYESEHELASTYDISVLDINTLTEQTTVLEVPITNAKNHYIVKDF